MRRLMKLLLLRQKVSRKLLRFEAVALMSNGYGEGEGRLQQAIDQALSSPLLNNNDVYNAQRILFNIYSSHDNEFRIDEMGEVHKFMARFRTKFRVMHSMIHWVIRLRSRFLQRDLVWMIFRKWHNSIGLLRNYEQKKSREWKPNVVLVKSLNGI